MIVFDEKNSFFIIIIIVVASWYRYFCAIYFLIFDFA